MTVLLDFESCLIRLAQFFLDGFELLPQEVFPLGFLYLGLGFGLDLLTQFQNLHLSGQDGDQLPHFVGHTVEDQDLLSFCYLDTEVGRNEVYQIAGVLHPGDELHDLVGQLRGEGHQAAGQV